LNARLWAENNKDKGTSFYFKMMKKNRPGIWNHC
jgi:hypothetical protein